MTDRELMQKALGYMESVGQMDMHPEEWAIAVALRERLADAPDGWKSIETAPKNGRKVIVFYLNSNNLPRTVMARWLTDEEAAETDADGVGLEGGWYECIDNWDDYTEVAIHEGEPTHWMPLPAAPQQGDKP